MKFKSTPIAFVLLIASQSLAQDFDQFIDDLGLALSVASEDGSSRARLSGTIDLEYHNFEGPAPSLINTNRSDVFQPRTTLFLDAQSGSSLYAFAQARIDRGFDPSDRHLRGRLDEYAIRYTPWADGSLNIQAGQFATVVGQWTHRHLSWKNPFITAPLFYENVTILTDQATDYTRFPSAYNAIHNRYENNPVIWGPSYATGVALSGRFSQFEWAAEVKNASLSSGPGRWPLDSDEFDHPTFSGRIAWRPSLQWKFGLSASEGDYLSQDVTNLQEIDADRGDFQQRAVVFDATYEWRYLQVWAEAIHSEFDVPRRGAVDSTAFFIEAKYKFSPKFFGAIRGNYQSFSDVFWNGSNLGPWGYDIARIDIAGTLRLSAHSQIQLQLSNPSEEQIGIDRGLHFASRFTLRF